MKAKPSIICYGEVLWDVFPKGSKIGGAPLNVMYHLNQLGVDAKIISRVGDDEWGENLLSQLEGWGLSTEMCQIDPHYDTSKVIADVDTYTGETTYDIIAPVAWDFIEATQDAQKAVSASDAFVFGSLSMRNEVSRETLFNLLEKSNYSVFDVNIREPHYARDLILRTFEEVQLLKLNHNELNVIAHWIDLNLTEEWGEVKTLQDNFGIKEILVTKGESGASYYIGEDHYEVEAFPVSVVDTVGSGDAFLAAFLSEKFGNPNSDPQEQLEKAALLGAFVAGHEGACPDYDKDDLIDFRIG